MKKLFFLAATTLFAFIANAQPPNVPADKGAKFGAEVTEEKAITVEDLAKQLNAQSGKVDVKVKGMVSQVCEAEGCWLRMKNGDGTIMVRMKDHSFFVPVVMNGKTIVVEGIAELKETSVAQLKHYAEDAGKSKAEIDAIKEPKKEVVIQAKGILVL